MRFKTIFIIFNIVIVCSFLLIFFMPLILLGGEHFGDFFLKNWYIGILFLGTLALFNIYFIRNWELFQLLEKEDWASLIIYLENKIFQNGILRKNYIRILINSYLVTSNTESIVKLESHLAEKHPKLIRKFAVQFGIPYLLRNQPQESEKYFGKRLAEKGLKESGWIRWNYAFSLLQLKEPDAAKDDFRTLIEKEKDPVLVLLSLYMLKSLSQVELDLKTLIEEKINAFKKNYSPISWSQKIDRAKGSIQVLILSKIIKDATDWIFKQKPAAHSDFIN